jgi:hypothetical protein
MEGPDFLTRDEVQHVLLTKKIEELEFEIAKLRAEIDRREKGRLAMVSDMAKIKAIVDNRARLAGFK